MRPLWKRCLRCNTHQESASCLTSFSVAFPQVGVDVSLARRRGTITRPQQKRKRRKVGWPLAVAQKSSRMDLSRWYLPWRPLTCTTCGKCVIGDQRILISVRLLCVLHARHLSFLSVPLFASPFPISPVTHSCVLHWGGLCSDLS